MVYTLPPWVHRQQPGDFELPLGDASDESKARDNTHKSSPAVAVLRPAVRNGEASLKIISARVLIS